MKRIAILFEFGTLNGGEHSMFAVLDALDENEFEFVVIGPEVGQLHSAAKSRQLQFVSLRLHDQTGNRLPREIACQHLITSIDESSAELVHANSLAMGRLTGAIRETVSIRTLAHLRDIIKLSRAAVGDLNRNDALVAVSNATKEFHVAQGVETERTHVLYNGVDCRRFCPRQATGSLRRELGLPDSAFLVATIGQISLRKAQDVLAQAAATIDNSRDNIHYLVIGERNSTKDESVQFERDLQHRFDASGIRDRLHLLGYRTDVGKLMNEIDLLVHPAHQEPLGRVLLEAAAAGLPIVATDVGGTSEILNDGHSARLIRPDDPKMLASAIEELIRDPEMRQRFATAARAEIELRFPVQRAAEELRRLWKTQF